MTVNGARDIQEEKRRGVKDGKLVGDGNKAGKGASRLD